MDTTPDVPETNKDAPVDEAAQEEPKKDEGLEIKEEELVRTGKERKDPRCFLFSPSISFLFRLCGVSR